MILIKRFWILPLVLLLFSTGCGEEDTDEQTSGQGDNQNDTDREAVADNLETPWSIEQSDGTFYITERAGSIVQVDDDGTERQEVSLSEEMSTASEAGLLGFVLAPDFPETEAAYAYYTYESDDGQFNRIVRLELNDGAWTEESVLLDGIPSGSVHHGGRLAIGPDDMLYATTGDASEADIAQDTDSLGGNILRMNLDGSAPEDNPMSDSYVYSYGHRNPQGLAWSADDTMYSSEHGASANDEVNVIENGLNYGWPVIEGEEEAEDMESPLFTSGGDTTWAPSGMAYHDERLYVAALAGNALLEFDLETEEERQLFTGYGRIRDVMIDDENLYFVTNNTDGRGNPDDDDDKLYRVPLSELD